MQFLIHHAVVLLSLHMSHILILAESASINIYWYINLWVEKRLLTIFLIKLLSFRRCWTQQTFIISDARWVSFVLDVKFDFSGAYFVCVGVSRIIVVLIQFIERLAQSRFHLQNLILVPGMLWTTHFFYAKSASSVVEIITESSDKWLLRLDTSKHLVLLRTMTFS